VFSPGRRTAPPEEIHLAPGGPFTEAADLHHRFRRDRPDRPTGLDPPVLAIGLGGCRGPQDQSIRSAPDEAGHAHDVRHEGNLVAPEVVGREQDDQRLHVAPRDPEQGGGRTPILRRHEDPPALAGQKLLERDGQRRPREGLLEERAGAGQPRIRRSTPVAGDQFSRGPETLPLAPGLNDDPGSTRAIPRVQARGQRPILTLL